MRVWNDQSEESRRESGPPKVIGSKPAFEAHLKTCEAYHASVTVVTEQAGMSTSTSSDLQGSSISDGPPMQSLSANPLKRPRQSAINEYCPAPLKADRKKLWHNLVLEFQAESLLAASFVELPSFKRMITFANTKCATALPNRRQLGGSILDNYSTASIADEEALLRNTQKDGLRVNVLSDGWQSIAKTHLLGVMLSLQGIISTYGTFACGHRHDAIALAEQVEELIVRMGDQGWNIGAIVTDNAGNCARARRILALRWPKVIFLFCFAHQIQLLVKDVIKTSFQVVANQAYAIVKTFNNSSAKWLPRLRELMSKMYGTQLALLLMAETRWNSLQGMFASILRCKTAFNMFYLQWHTADDFPDAFLMLSSINFWKNVSLKQLCYNLLK